VPARLIITRLIFYFPRSDASFLRNSTRLSQKNSFDPAGNQQQRQIEALTATIQKVSERVELSAPAQQIAANED